MIEMNITTKATKLIVEKDRHIQRKEPFFSAHKAYIEWLLESEFNSPEYNFFSLGDFFHHSKPSPEEYSLAIDFFNRAKFEKIFILKGNHDYSRIFKSLSIDPLSKINKIVLIEDPTYIKLNDTRYLCLPFIYENMREVYSNLDSKYYDSDFIFYHFEDETINFGGNIGIDISYLKGKRIGGHIHLKCENYELGMPVNSNFDEKNQVNELGIIDGLNFEIKSIPTFLDYGEVTYPNPLPKTNAKFQIWDIRDVPNKKSWKEVYGNIYTREISKLRVDSDVTIKEKKNSLTEYFKDFMKDKKPNLSSSGVSRIMEILSKRSK